MRPPRTRWRRPRLRTATFRCAPRSSAYFGDKPVSEFLVPKDIVRHIVVTVDNLPRKKVAVELRPVKATPGTTARRALRMRASSRRRTTSATRLSCRRCVPRMPNS